METLVVFTGVFITLQALADHRYNEEEYVNFLVQSIYGEQENYTDNDYENDLVKAIYGIGNPDFDKPYTDEDYTNYLVISIFGYEELTSATPFFDGNYTESVAAIEPGYSPYYQEVVSEYGYYTILDR